MLQRNIKNAEKNRPVRTTNIDEISDVNIVTFGNDNYLGETSHGKGTPVGSDKNIFNV